MFSNLLSSLQLTDPDSGEQGKNSNEKGVGENSSSSSQGGHVSFWGVAAAVAGTVRATADDFVKTVKQTDWQSELTNFGKEVAHDTKSLGSNAVHLVDQLPLNLDGVSEEVFTGDFLTASADGTSDDIVAAHFEQVGSALANFGRSLVEGTQELVGQVREAVETEIAAVAKEQKTNQRGRSMASGSRLHAGAAGKYNRFEAEVTAMQRDSSTYCDEPEDKEEFAAWKASFHLPGMKKEISKIIMQNAFMSELQARIVPMIVEYEDFWTRYFYRLHKLQLKEAQRQELHNRMAKEEDVEVGWDDDDTSIKSPTPEQPTVTPPSTKTRPPTSTKPKPPASKTKAPAPATPRDTKPPTANYQQPQTSTTPLSTGATQAPTEQPSARSNAPNTPITSANPASVVTTTAVATPSTVVAPTSVAPATATASSTTPASIAAAASSDGAVPSTTLVPASAAAACPVADAVSSSTATDVGVPVALSSTSSLPGQEPTPSATATTTPSQSHGDRTSLSASHPSSMATEAGTLPETTESVADATTTASHPAALVAAAATGAAEAGLEHRGGEEALTASTTEDKAEGLTTKASIERDGSNQDAASDTTSPEWCVISNASASDAGVTSLDPRADRDTPHTAASSEPLDEEDEDEELAGVTADGAHGDDDDDEEVDEDWGNWG